MKFLSLALAAIVSASAFSQVRSIPNASLRNKTPTVKQEETAESYIQTPREIPADAEFVTLADEQNTETAPEYITIDGTKYYLTFEENFDGDELDETKWEKVPEGPHEECVWRDEMSEVGGEGTLVLHGDFDGDIPISGGIRTKGRFEQAYGFFEARMKLQDQKIRTGFWGGFWMMCGNPAGVDGSSVDGIELDMVSSASRQYRSIYQSYTYDGYGEDTSVRVQRNVKGTQYYGEWHTYAVRWTEEEYIFYVDGEITWRTEAGGICQTPGYIKLTTQLAADSLPEYFPDTVEVDWVRIYQEEGK